MSPPMFTDTSVKAAIAALRRDLIHPDGPRISTMRNYRFAIVQYEPKDEFELRAEVQRLSGELQANGWVVLPLSLHKLLLDRVRAQGEEWLRAVIERERRASARHGMERGLRHVMDKLAPLIEGPDGIAADCARLIRAHAERHPDMADRTLALIGRAGALYPFFRTSSLLKHLNGRTADVPVVLLYPGHRRGDTGLSFMGVIEPDRDYRPRIYP